MNPAASLVRNLVLGAIFASAVVVAGCTGSTVAPAPTPTATPTTSAGTESPAAASTSVPVTAGGTEQLAATANGQVASLGFAAGAPAGVTLSATSSTTAPGSAPAPSSVRRSTASIAGAVPFYWVTFTVSAALPAQDLSTESVTLTSADPTTASYYAEFDDITSTPATKLASFGPATIGTAAVIQNTTVTGATTPTLQTGHTYLLQFYYIPAATASPSPSAAPSASASPAPSASPSVSPSPAPPSPSPTATATATPLPTFTFSGSTDNDGPTSCNTTSCFMLYLSPGGIFQFPAASAATSLTLTAASGASQISPSSSFPYLTGQGTVIEYLQVTASPAVTFATTPSIMLNGAVSGETTCSFYGYENTSAGYAWTLIAGPAAVSGSSVTIPAVAPGGAPINVSPTPFYGAVACTP